MHTEEAARLFGTLFALSFGLNVMLTLLLRGADRRGDELARRLVAKAEELERVKDAHQKTWTAAAETIAEARTEPARPTGGPEDWFGCDEQEGGD